MFTSSIILFNIHFKEDGIYKGMEFTIHSINGTEFTYSPDHVAHLLFSIFGKIYSNHFTHSVLTTNTSGRILRGQPGSFNLLWSEITPSLNSKRNYLILF